MSTVVDYFKYAQIATAAYVRMGTEPLTGQRFAEVARDQRRFPLSIAQYLFDPNVTLYGTRDTWHVLQYYGSDNTSDPIAAADQTGFAATLFQQGGDQNGVGPMQRPDLEMSSRNISAARSLRRPFFVLKMAL